MIKHKSNVINYKAIENYEKNKIGGCIKILKNNISRSQNRKEVYIGYTIRVLAGLEFLSSFFLPVCSISILITLKIDLDIAY